VVRGRGGAREGAEGVLGRGFFFRRLGDLEGVRVLEFGGVRTRGNSGGLGEGVKGRGRGGRGEAGSLVAFGERVSNDGRGSTRERGFSARREYEIPRGYPCTSGVRGSRGEGVFFVLVDSTREVFLGVLGEIFDAEVTGEGETRGSCDTCTRGETSSSVVVSNAGTAKAVKERGHLVIPWSAMIRLSKCEELTTYETREVVAVPNSRSRGGV
jgi:hypothetical protein